MQKIAFFLIGTGVGVITVLVFKNITAIQPKNTLASTANLFSNKKTGTYTIYRHIPKNTFPNTQTDSFSSYETKQTTYIEY